MIVSLSYVTVEEELLCGSFFFLGCIMPLNIKALFKQIDYL